ncbi:uncharacterized protein METZ01_LOCUS31858, partial [marine metagenome]|tara:strand:+ start:949 stop:1731 length:783 start_codon:yes stop_codon:yes gene_type:complete
VLIVLSPAKTLDFDSELQTHKHSLPALVNESAKLVKTLIKKSPDDLGQLMHLSPALADLSAERYQDWEAEFTTENSRPALLAFKGDVYVGMDVNRYNERDFTRAQKTLRILSGLHGVLRPLDLIQPYRLEMGTRLATDRGTDLYEFWGDRITAILNTDLEGHRSRVLINLASKEYFSAIDESLLSARVVSPRFLDEKNGKFKIISFYAKRARGAMASWLILNRVETPGSIVEFAEMGYRYAPDRSTSDEPTFVRAEGVSN